MLAGILIALSALLGVYIKFSLQGPRQLAPDQGFTLKGVTVWNPGSEPKENQTLVATAGNISQIIERAVSTESGAYHGHFVMPGLIDMHVHLLDGMINDLRNVSGILNLYYGVTSVRDTGSTSEIFRMREEVASGGIVGPRIFACGRAFDGKKSYAPVPIIQSLASPEEAVEAVRIQKELGADCIKVLSGIEADTFAALSREAQKSGLSLIGHVPRSIPMTEIRLDDAQHLFGTNEASGVDGSDEVGGDKLERVSAARIRDVVDHSKKVGMAHTPTLIVYENVYNVRNMAEIKQTGQEYMPHHYPNVVFHSGLRKSLPASRRTALTVRDSEQHRRIYNMRLATVKAMHEAKVPLHLGADAPFGSLSVPGAAMHEEITAFLKAGISLEDTLQMATASSGQALGMPGLGSIVEGAPADLLIFERDPRSDWKLEGNLVAVVANGRLYPREQLQRYLNEYQDRYNSFVLRDLLPAALRMLFF